MAPLYKLITVVLTVATLGVTASCQSTTSGGAVGANRQQFLLVSSGQLNQMAARAYNQLLAESAKKGALNTDAALTKRVRAIATRITPQTRVFRADAPGWKWEVNTITSKELNAFCMPGGKIMFYSGLIQTLKLSDDEIAVVMGHEIAHALREHSRERASQPAVASVGISVVAAVVGVGSLGQRGMEYAYQGLLGLPNSRTHEIEADRMGVELAARAGYDPRAAVSLWKKMGEVGGKEPPKFMSTHPPRGERMEDLAAYSEKVLPLYQQSKR
ncbi:MAG: M48 family metallopeptidase [Burkholderiaceae bacterium]